MEKLDLRQDNGENLETAIVGEMLKSLSREAVMNAYNARLTMPRDKSDRADEMLEKLFLFIGLLYDLGYSYIQQAGLEPGNEDYAKVVDTLALLAGFTNGWAYCLTRKEQEQCIKRGALPLNIECLFDSFDPEHVVFPQRSRFRDVVRLAMNVYFGYEIPASEEWGGTPKHLQADGYDALRQCAIFKLKKEMEIEAYMESRARGENPAGGSVTKSHDGGLDFEI